MSTSRPLWLLPLALALILSLNLISLPAFGRRQAADHIVITEVMYDAPQTGADSDYEWVELFNPTGAAIDLTDWMLKDNSSQDPIPGVLLEPGDYLVIAASLAGFQANYPGFVGNLVTLGGTIGNGLSNTGDVVKLSAPGGVVIDAVSYGVNTEAFDPPCSGIPSGQSLARVPSDQDTDTSADWAEQVLPNPGSPGTLPATSTSTVTPTPSDTVTSTPTVTPTPSRTVTSTPTATPPPSDTGTPTPTVTPPPSHTVTSTPSVTPAPSYTFSPTSTASPTAIPSVTPTATPVIWPQVLLSEVLYDAAQGGADSAWEWVEVYNPNSISVDLAGWRIGDNSARDAIPAFGLAPGGYLVIAATAAGFLADHPGFIGNLVSVGGTLGNGLSNAGDMVRLIAPDGAVLDAMSYGDNREVFVPACPDVPEGQSLARVPSDRDTDVAADWVAQASPNPGELGALPAATPTQTSTPTYTATPTRTVSPTPSPTVMPTPTHTITPTPTVTPAPSYTSTPTVTASPAASTASPSVTLTSTSVVWPQVLLNELLPWPDAIDWDGDGTVDAYDEWIEAINLGPDVVDLGGWTLDDILGGGSSPYTFPAGTVLEPGEFLVCYRSATGVALNQDADTVNLVAPDGRVVDSFSYSNPRRDASYSRATDGTGDWIDTYPPSPGGPNIAPTPTPTLPYTVTPTPSPTVTPTATMTAVIYDPDAIRLNEVLPAPDEIDWDGDGEANAADEWIEIYNLGAAPADLGGWMLDDIADGGSQPYTLPADTQLPPGSFLVLYRSGTGIALNNDEDTVRLLGPDGVEADAFAYHNPRADRSYSRAADGTGAWTDAYPPSPGRANVPATPTPMLTITPTLTHTVTPTPTVTLTLTHTVTPTPTVTSTLTHTVTPIATASPTASPTATPTATPVAWPQVLLSEVLYDAAQSGVDSAWEWVEVYNPNSISVDLASWRIGDNSAQDAIPAFGLAPGGYLVIAATQAGFLGNYPGFAGNLVSVEGTLGNGLSNTGDVVRLIAPDGAVLDAMSYGDNREAFDPACPDAPEGQSLARVPSDGDTDVAADWVAQASPNPGEAGALPAATPTQTPTPTYAVTNTATSTAIPTATSTPTSAPVTAHPGDVVINEIMQNPGAVLDEDGEWFEVYNTTGQAIDLNGWIIKDDGADRHTIVNGGPLWLPAGGHLVLGRNADSATNGGVAVAYQYKSFTLGNSDDEVILLGATGIEIDRVAYDDGPAFPDPTGASMMLIQPDADNAVGSNWRTAVVRWPGGAGDAGSPGAVNHTASVEGYIYEDRDGNGHRGLDELTLGIPDVLMTLRAVAPGSLTLTWRTSSRGWYGFYDLPAGAYQVVETQPEDYVSTTPDQVTVVLAAGDNRAGHDFGEQRPTPSPTPTGAYTVTPTPTSTATPTLPYTITPTPTATTGDLAQMLLNELLPRPEAIDWDGNGTVDAYDEWIEIFNLGPDAVDLGGWVLDDILGGGSSPYTFPPGTLLGPGEFLVRFRSATGVALNQDADTVNLVAPDGRVADSFSYSNPRRDASYSRTTDGTGAWTDAYPPSPGGPNLAPTPTPTLPYTITPPPSPTATPTAIMTAVIYDPEAIRLNEVLPAPDEIDWDGDGEANAADEWIEIYNLGTAPADLGGWMLDDIADGGSQPYTLPADTQLPPGSFLVLYRSGTGTALNNDEDTVRLLGPDGAEVDAFAYHSPRTDRSYSRAVDGSGAWTDAYPPSPGRANVPATPTPTATPTATPTQFPTGVTLNEVLPNPQAVDWDSNGTATFADEWVELYNAGSAPAALGGWALVDDTKVYTLPVGITIWPGSTLLLFRDQTGLTLSDYRDDVRLLRPDGAVADRFAYDYNPGADRSYCRSIDGGGYWTRECIVTPGQPNRLLPPPSDDASAPAPTATPAGWTAGIAAARSAAVDTRVTVTGAVVYPPGLLERTIYIQDATHGIKVYLRSGDFPPLALGDTVRVTGWTRDFHGEAELSAPNPGYLAVLASGPAPAPLPIATGNLGEAYEGRLVWLAGRIVKFETRALVLDDGTGPARIYFPEELPWRRPYVNIGEFWSAQGVVGQYAFDGPPYVGGYRLAPRFATDVSDAPGWLPVTGGEN